MEAVRRHAMVVAPPVLPYFKAAATLIAVLYELDPTFDVRDAHVRFFHRMIAEDAAEWLDPRYALRAAFGLVHRLRRALDLATLSEGAERSVWLAATRVAARIRVLAAAAVAIVLLLIYARADLALLHRVTRFPLGWLPTALVVLLVIVGLLLFHQSHRLPRAARRRRQNGRL